MKKNMRLALRSAAAITTLAAGAIAGTPAHASNVVIDSWTETQCIDDGYHLCLWYHPGYGTGGAGWGTENSVTLISGNFFLPGNPGNQGLGQPVRNDAGSMSNGTLACYDIAFTLPNYVGNSDQLSANMGGNLTNSNQQNPPLRNNEASVEITCG